MIYRPVPSNKYKRDLRLAVKQGKNIEELENVIDTLAAGKKLAANYEDHALKGKYAGQRECHIDPDWLLIYRIEKGLLILTLTRTGTHSRLFDE
jgi:mRNA interferase YafQ